MHKASEFATWPAFVDEAAKITGLPLTAESGDFLILASPDVDSLARTEFAVFLFSEFGLDLLDSGRMAEAASSSLSDLHLAGQATMREL